MAKTPAFESRILVLRERYLRAAVGKEELLRILGEAEVAEQVYDSNAIENSTLSLDETERILRQIDLDRYINERELFEAKNLARVVSYIAAKAKAQELNIEVMCLLHKMLIGNIRDDIAGRLRREGEYVRVGSHVAPAPGELVPRLVELLVEYNARVQLHIVKRIAALHAGLEHVHPFVDGNGRIGRVINNYLLIREGYVPINIRFHDRDEYYNALRAYDVGRETGPLESIVGRAITNSYHKRLAYLEGEEIVRLGDYAKRHRLSHAGLINKAHRQTIPAFLERGVWKIAGGADLGNI